MLGICAPNLEVENKKISLKNLSMQLCVNFITPQDFVDSISLP